MRMTNFWIGLLCLMVLLPQSVGALVAGERPGIQYSDQVLFLAKKIMENGRVAWITLAYEDPRSSKACRNFFDVLGGRELFADIPENSWLLVDFELRSLVVDAGFSGDADVTSVSVCNDYNACCRERDRRAATKPAEPAAVGEKSRRQTNHRKENHRPWMRLKSGCWLVGDWSKRPAVGAVTPSRGSVPIMRRA